LSIRGAGLVTDWSQRCRVKSLVTVFTQSAVVYRIMCVQT